MSDGTFEVPITNYQGILRYQLPIQGDSFLGTLLKDFLPQPMPCIQVTFFFPNFFPSFWHHKSHHRLDGAEILNGMANYLSLNWLAVKDFWTINSRVFVDTPNVRLRLFLIFCCCCCLSHPSENHVVKFGFGSFLQVGVNKIYLKMKINETTNYQ